MHKCVDYLLFLLEIHCDVFQVIFVQVIIVSDRDR